MQPKRKELEKKGARFYTRKELQKLGVSTINLLFDLILGNPTRVHSKLRKAGIKISENDQVYWRATGTLPLKDVRDIAIVAE